MLSMVVVGRIIHKTDDRLLVLAGFAGIGATCWILSRLNLDISLMNVGGPLILNGFAMGFIFVPMTTLSMETLRQDRIYQATGLYSLMRNIGGGIGISSLVTYLSRQAQVHQVFLASHLSAYDPIVQDRMRALAGMAAAGGAAGSQPAATASAMMYRSLLQQAQLLSFMDCFRGLAFLCLVSAPLVFLFGKPRKHKGEKLASVASPVLE
jgi:DHA2 family multidrug resistance protein